MNDGKNAADAIPATPATAATHRHHAGAAECTPIAKPTRAQASKKKPAPKMRPRLRRVELTADFVYVRFHAAPGDGSYTHRSLGQWCHRLREWASERTVSAYFNNDWRGYAPENAAYLSSRS